MRLREHPQGSALAAPLCSSFTPVLRQQQRSGGGCQIGGETEPNAPNINTAKGKCCEESDGARGPRSGFGVLVPAGLRGDAARGDAARGGEAVLPGSILTPCAYG